MSLYTFMFTESTLDRPWFIDAGTGRSITGTAMKTRTDALAQGLYSRLQLGIPYTSAPASHLEYGIRDVVGLVCPNSLDFGTVVWASHKLGCTVASIGAGSTVPELQHLFSLSGARTIFTYTSALGRVLEAAHHCDIPSDRILVIADGDDEVSAKTSGLLTVEDLVEIGKEACNTMESIATPIAFLCFSSGTTGLPKAVIVPHSSLISNIIQLRGSAVPSAHVADGDRALGVIPFSHAFGLITLVHFCPHIGIATVAFKSMPSFPAFLQSIVRLRIGHLFLVPPLVNAFVKHPRTPDFDLTFFKTAMVAAAPLDREMEVLFQRIGSPEFLVTQGFGMTECGGLITALPVGTPPRPGSVGRLLSSTEAKIVDEVGNPLEPGRRGHLCVRGPQVCPGYLGNPEATRNAFDADGFLLTGDMAEMSPDGYFHIVDRLKFMIKNKGYSVSPAELEAHLLGLDVVQDAAVIGRPDERCGEVPVAFIVLSTSGLAKDKEAVETAIMQSVKETKSEFKWLHAVYIVQSIPRLPSGKIVGNLLKGMLHTRAVDYPVPSSPSASVSLPRSKSYLSRLFEGLPALLKSMYLK
ncbi:hypothetical protein C8J57DRAFT_1177999 [Mycena rebaudengoi]|nr:hypothetical protein C8J57DRAFT_1177999 [Mycena rebaudengoi]